MTRYFYTEYALCQTWQSEITDLPCWKSLSLWVNKLYTLILPPKRAELRRNSAPGFYMSFPHLDERLGGKSRKILRIPLCNQRQVCPNSGRGPYIAVWRPRLESDGIINFISQFSRFFDLLTFFDLPWINSPRFWSKTKRTSQRGQSFSRVPLHVILVFQ